MSNYRKEITESALKQVEKFLPKGVTTEVKDDGTLVLNIETAPVEETWVDVMNRYEKEAPSGKSFYKFLRDEYYPPKPK